MNLVADSRSWTETELPQSSCRRHPLVYYHVMNNRMPTENVAPLKIAIAGSGIAGLAAGWLLAKEGHQVTVFEKQASLGMDAHGWDLLDHPLSADLANSVSEMGPLRIDVPPRLFNPQLWPNLVQLYQQAGIETVPIDPTKCYCNDDRTSYLRLKRGYQPAWTDLWRSRSRMIAHHSRRLLVLARQWQQAQNWPTGTLRELWQEHRFPEAYVQFFLYPALASTVCTCDYAALDNYPAAIVLPALLQMIDGSELHRTRLGSRDVVQRLSQGLDIQLKACVSQAQRVLEQDWDSNHHASGIRLQINGQEQWFDHLIVATQANHVASIVDDLTTQERVTLEGFQYVQAPVVLHNDKQWMPRRRSDWSHFNIFLQPQATTHSATQAACTMWMNCFRDDWNWAGDLFQTIMPLQPPNPSAILATAVLQRPVVTLESWLLWDSLNTIQQQPDRCLWFCGSYASPGIPLLQSGVASAQAIASRILQSRHAQAR